MKTLALILFAVAAPIVVSAAPTVGIEGRVEVLLPGPELKAKAAERTAPLVLRIADTRPHGTLISYDLRYIGFVPGAYDLGKYLLQPDGTPAAGLPPIPVEIASVLPAEHQGQLSPREQSPLGFLGGYQWLMIGAVALWAAIAFPLFRSGKRLPEASAMNSATALLTLAERLRPLVERATTGQLTANEQAQLERLLLSHWQQRLGLETLDPSEAMNRLRAHPEAGSLLRSLEDWLHRPPGSARVDVATVLAPYSVPPDAAPAPAAA